MVARERFRRSFVTANPLSDYTLPLISLYAGRRVTRLLRLSFGEKEMLEMAKARLVDEISAAKSLGEEAVNAELDTILPKMRVTVPN